MVTLSFSFISFQVFAQPTAPLPVLLIHGYDSTATAWRYWDNYLTHDHIVHKAVTFTKNDPCGSAKDHAIELKKIIDDYKLQTHSDKINVVAHSKGGLDTRIYLDDNPNSNAISNFIMIGTPNRGSPVEDQFHDIDECIPASDDLLTNSSIAKSTDSEINNPNTNYYTIAGDWTPVPFYPYVFDYNCIEGHWRYALGQLEGSQIISGSDDGLVPLVNNAEIKSKYHSLGETNNCHTNLLDKESYDLARPILMGH